MVKWVDTMWLVLTTEYYSPMKGNEVMAPATVWMNPGNMVSFR